MAERFPSQRAPRPYPPQPDRPSGRILAWGPARGIRLGWALWLFLLLAGVDRAQLGRADPICRHTGQGKGRGRVAPQSLDRPQDHDRRLPLPWPKPPLSVVGVKASRIVRGETGDELSSFLFGPRPPSASRTRAPA